MTDQCMVFFQSDKCNLADAISSLKSYGFTVVNKNERLLVDRKNSQKFEIILASGSMVLDEAIEISENTEHSSEMKKCNHRFEVLIPDLEEALDEINTLIEIQGALQDASQGYLFTPWNNNLSEPWIE